MSALPQPDFRDLTPVKLPISPPKTALKNSSVTPQKNYQRKTTKLSRKNRSAALKLLTLVQKGSSGLAAVMMLSSVSVYLSTVSIPQKWSQEYENLEALQSQERQLVALDEALKYEIAQQAEQPELEMSMISPENTIFIKPASVKPQAEQIAVKKKLWHSIPSGY